MDSQSKNFGPRLRAVLEEKSVPLERAWQELGISRATLFNWLNRETPPPSKRHLDSLRGFFSAQELAHILDGSKLPGITDRPREDSLAESAHALPGQSMITRDEIEARLKAFLDAAERVPGGLGWASVQISMHLRPEQLRTIDPAYDPLTEIRRRVAALQRNQGGASQQRAS